MRNSFTASLIAIALSSSQMVSGQAMAASPAALPVGTCINMGNSLEPEQEGSWGGQPIAAQDFTRIKAAGFDTVRIPVRWHNKSSSQAPYTIDPAWMARVAQVVDQALAADLNVILNSHHFDPIHEDPLAVSAWHGGVWSQIAPRFKDYPTTRLWFELENEPHNKFDHSNLLATLAPALAAVRATNPTRPVIYGGENWSGVDSLATLPLPDDDNVYPTFHYYEPFEYTHQGAEWTAPNVPAPGRRYGSAADASRLAADVEKVRAYITRTGKVPFMGETGAFDKHSATAERAAYHQAITDAFAPTGVGICTWAYANTFPFYDHAKGQWLPGMVEALKPSGLGSASAAAAPKPFEEDIGPPSGRKLPSGLEVLDAELPGYLVNDPASLAWDSYGPAIKVDRRIDAAIPGGGAALVLTNRTAGDPWSAGISIPVLANIDVGQQITIGFWARTVSAPQSGGTGSVSVRFQQNSEPYPGFGDRNVSIGSDWKFYEATARADRTIRRKDAIVAIQFGQAVQTIEIGQAIVVVGASSILQ